VTGILKWTCVGAWSLQLLLTFYNSLVLPRPFIADGIDVTADLLHREHLLYGWIGVGLAVALIGLRLKRWWILTTVVSSLTYLVVWYLRGPMSLVGAVAGYKLLWGTATRFGFYTSFFTHDLLIPVALLAALAGALVQLFARNAATTRPSQG
jgi:hypothetical protein